MLKELWSLLTQFKQAVLAESWFKLNKIRRRQIFKYKYVPVLPVKRWRYRLMTVFIGLGVALALLVVSYISLVIVVLNLRYYTGQWFLAHMRPGGLRTLVAVVAFKPNLTGQTKYPKLSVVIPKIGVDAPIIPDVSASDYREYMAALKKGVALARGTGLPGDGRRSYLFAHSTNINPIWVSRYNAVFYLLSKLKIGDDIYIWRDGRRLKYKVKEIRITSKNDTYYLSPGQQEELVLQTCYPPGTTLRRFLVIAEPVSQ